MCVCVCVCVINASPWLLVVSSAYISELLHINTCTCAPTSFNSDMLATSQLPSISSKSLKRGDILGDAPFVSLFSFAFLYKSFKFLNLSVHCFFVFSPSYFANSFLIVNQTSLQQLDFMRLMFSFHTLTSFSVCV